MPVPEREQDTGTDILTSSTTDSSSAEVVLDIKRLPERSVRATRLRVVLVRYLVVILSVLSCLY